MAPNHLVLCCPLLLPPSIFPSIRVFSNKSTLHIRWPKYWSFSLSISPSSEYSGLISFRMVGSPCNPRDFQESSPTPQFKSINSSALSCLHSPTVTSIRDHWKNHGLEENDKFISSQRKAVIVIYRGELYKLKWKLKSLTYFGYLFSFLPFNRPTEHTYLHAVVLTMHITAFVLRWENCRETSLSCLCHAEWAGILVAPAWRSQAGTCFLLKHLVT